MHTDLYTRMEKYRERNLFFTDDTEARLNRNTAKDSTQWQCPAIHSGTE